MSAAKKIKLSEVGMPSQSSKCGEPVEKAMFWKSSTLLMADKVSMASGQSELQHEPDQPIGPVIDKMCCKHSNVFDRFADRTQSNQPISSTEAISNIWRAMDGVLPLPHTTYRTSSPMSNASIEDGLATMFKRLGLEHPQRCGDSARKHFTTHAFTKPEVYEFFWQNMAWHVDIRIQSYLPSDQSSSYRSKRINMKKSPYEHQVSSGGSKQVWPRNHTEWIQASAVVALGIPGVECLNDVFECVKPTSVDDVVDYIVEACMYALGAKVDAATLHQHIGPLCLNIEPSKFLANTLIRTNVLSEVLGDALSTIVRRWQYENDWQLELPIGSEDYLSIAIQELTDTRCELLDLKATCASGRLDLVRGKLGKTMVLSSSTPRLCNWKADKEKASRKSWHDKVRLLVSTNANFRCLGKSMAFITELTLKGRDASGEVDHIHGDRMLWEYVSWLDEAPDGYIQENLRKVWLIIIQCGRQLQGGGRTRKRVRVSRYNLLCARGSHTLARAS